MLQTALKAMSAIKGYLIAFVLFVVGLLAAVLVGKEKQKAADNAVAQKVVTHELDKISTTSAKVQGDVAKLPPVGPDSAAEQLRNDWDDGN